MNRYKAPKLVINIPLQIASKGANFGTIDSGPTQWLCVTLSLVFVLPFLGVVSALLVIFTTSLRVACEIGEIMWLIISTPC